MLRLLITCHRSSGTISSYMAACVNIHVPNNTDLVLIEYSVNDVSHRDFENEYRRVRLIQYYSIPAKTCPQNRRSYERLIRKILALPHQPAIILVHSYNWMSPPISSFYNSIERELYELSLFYDLPAISLKSAVYHELRKGSEARDGFFVDKARMEDVEGLAGRSFYYDKIHPDALTGARVMGELAFHMVSKGREGSGSADDEDALSPQLPPPMFKNNYAAASERCFIGSNLQNVIVSARGYDWLNDSKGRAAKFGYISTRKGDELRIKVNTVASSSPSTPARASSGEEGEEKESSSLEEQGKESTLVQVQIIHLRSYEGMGTATVKCESYCTCEAGKLVGHQRARNSQLFLQSIFVTQSPECVISITTDPGPRASSRIKVKVAGVIVSEEPGEQKGSAKSVEVVEMVSSVAAESDDGLFDVTNKKRP
jgi:hypothetical protein